ncbi:cobalamin adenosyltransferase [Vulcanisaeta thermophila]|uniref:cobalamin adenosyltransferase n=1 Tax=Vulcanisaeta thermophila TaxID=867917 RepID=UPI00085385CD|nr:cobalamin adenosyltransferase [Vulcanisaeta thermophila]
MSDTCRLPLFIDCREVGDEIKCPGDGGYSVIPIFGKRARVRKDDPSIRLMGCLDELVNVANRARLEFKGVSDIASIVMALSMQLNSYLVLGSDDRLARVKSLEGLLMRVVTDKCRGFRGPTGWVIASSPELQALDGIRVKLRECGRIAASLFDEYDADKVGNIMAILNHADKLVAQLLYCLGGSVFRSVDDAVNYLISDIEGKDKRF